MLRPRIGRPTLHPAPTGELPTTPPAEALQAVDRAARRAEELWDDGRELHFAVGADGRVAIHVRNFDGRVLRSIPPSEALELLSDPYPTPSTMDRAMTATPVVPARPAARAASHRPEAYKPDAVGFVLTVAEPEQAPTPAVPIGAVAASVRMPRSPGARRGARAASLAAPR